MARLQTTPKWGICHDFLELYHATGREAGDPILPASPRVGGRNPRSCRSPGTPGPALALPPRQAHPAAAPRLSSRLTLYPAPHQALAPSSSMKQRGHTAATNVPSPTNGHRRSERASRRPAAPTAAQVKGQKKKKKKNPDFFLNPRGGETRFPQRWWGLELQVTEDKGQWGWGKATRGTSAGVGRAGVGRPTRGHQREDGRIPQLLS